MNNLPTPSAQVPFSSGCKVFDVAEPGEYGVVFAAGAEVSAVKFGDGVYRQILNIHLRAAGISTDERDRLDSPTENTRSEATIIQHAQGAWNRLRISLSWEDWTTVGAAHVIGRATAMRDAHTNKPEGRGYNAAFAAWARKFGFTELDKGDRARLFQVMDHLAEIEAWLAQRPLTERLRLNHPSSVWRKWKASAVVPDPNAPPKVSPVQKLKDSVAALQEENDRMKREIERGGGDLWTPEDTPEKIAEIMAGKLTISKVERTAREMLKIVKAAKGAAR